MSTPPENCQKLDPMDAMMRLFPQESRVIPGFAQKKGFYSDLHRSILNVDRVERGRVICSLTIDSAVANKYMTLHGGAVASVAEMVSLACVKTVAGDKDFFLGELSTAYLSSAKLNEVITVDASILRHGRSVVVTSVNFSAKKTGKLLYTSRSTFYIMPVAIKIDFAFTGVACCEELPLKGGVKHLKCRETIEVSAAESYQTRTDVLIFNNLSDGSLHAHLLRHCGQ